MSSIVVAGDVSGSVTIAAPSAAGSTTLTLPSTSGTIVTTATSTGISASALSTGTVGTARLGSGTADSTTYLRGDQSWATISSGGMTLLGTVTATSGNSVSLGSLDLSTYKELHIVASSVSHSAATGAICYVSSDNSQTLNYYALYIRNGQINSGILIINLPSGSFMATSSTDSDPGNGVPIGGKLNITTATTTVYFRLASTSAFSAGSFLVYGVK